MELRHLHTFTIAAELLNFTRAAENIGLTQAAVSQHIAALERNMGVALFERTGRTVSLTESGRKLYEYACKILDLVDEARHAVTGAETAISGTLRIAVSTVPAEILLPDLLAEFRKHYPEVHQSVTVSDSRTAAKAVENGNADLGLVGELPQSDRLMATAIASDELILVVSPEHRFAKKKKTTLKQLQAEPLIVREAGSGSRRCVERALEEAGVSFDNLSIAMEINSNEAIRAEVERNVGVAFLSQLAIKRDIAAGHLVPVKVAGLRPQRQLYLVTSNDRVMCATVRLFLEFIDGWKKQRPMKKQGGQS